MPPITPPRRHVAVFIVSKILWLLALPGVALGAVFFVEAILGGQGAPQQGAAGALAAASAILPYVLARTWDELTAPNA